MRHLVVDVARGAAVGRTPTARRRRAWRSQSVSELLRLINPSPSDNFMAETLLIKVLDTRSAAPQHRAGTAVVR